MATRQGILSALQGAFMKRAPEPRQIVLAAKADTIVCIRPQGQRIRIVSGHAWITSTGKDILLEAGQQALLPRTGDAVIISGVGAAPLIFEVIHPSQRKP